MTAPGQAVRTESFGALGELAYLDTASKGIPPERAITAMREAVTELGDGEAEHQIWESAAERARGMVADMLGTTRERVALLPNQVTAASMIARRITGPVVVPEAEYRSNLLPWITERERVRLVPSPASTERLCAAIDDGAELLAVSSVQAAEGTRVELAELVAHAHRRGTRVYVDASQSFGVDTELADCGADFLAAVGYKWLLGTRGAAFLVFSEETAALFPPLLAAPQGVEDVALGVWHGAEYRFWEDARRFDQPPAWLSWVGTEAALAELSGIPIADREAHALGLAEAFREQLGLPGPTERATPIVVVPHEDPVAAQRLLRAEGVRAAARGRCLRFAFHLYNTEQDLRRAVRALHALKE